MNEETKLVVAMVAFALGIHAATKMIQHKCEQQKIRKEIEAKTDRELQAIKIAAAVVTERIRTGKYAKSGFAAIQTDFEFERIVALNPM